MYMWKKYSEKLDKYLWRDLFYKVLFAALKYKKALTKIMMENLCFKQLRLNYLNNQKKQKTKIRTPKISNKLC